MISCLSLRCIIRLPVKLAPFSHLYSLPHFLSSSSKILQIFISSPLLLTFFSRYSCVNDSFLHLYLFLLSDISFNKFFIEVFRKIYEVKYKNEDNLFTIKI